MAMKMNRRSFVGLGAAFAAAGCCSDKPGFPAITAVRSPNGLLRHACFGCGNKAWDDITCLRTHAKIEMAAFCDVDAKFLARAQKAFPKARFYRDWREMMATEGDKIDSVNISIPDHNHVIAADAAFRAGKHVYLQKPLCKTMAESKFLRDQAKAARVVTQMGAQFNASMGDRLTVALLKAQALGPVEEVHFFSTRKGLSRRRRHLPASVAAPATLDWNLWLGTAPVRDYAPEVYHPLIWRVWHDFGSGWIGDIGCHLMSAAWRGMDLGCAAPLDVIASTGTDAASPEIAAVTWPTMSHIEWNFAGVPASGGKPFKFIWNDGCSAPDNLAPAKFRPTEEIERLFAASPFKKRPFEGKAVKCREGWILQPHGGKDVYAVRHNGTPIALPTLPAAPSHYHEFVDACLAGKPASTDFAWSTYMMETVLTGAVAERVADTKLAWCPVSRTFGNPQADKLLRPVYRAGWNVAGLA